MAGNRSKRAALINHSEILAGKAWRNNKRSGSCVGVCKRAIGIGVHSGSSNKDLGVRHATNHLGAACVGAEISGDILIHLARDRAVMNHALLKENVSIGGIDHKICFLVIGNIKCSATSCDKFNRKLGGLNILIQASPNHIARRVHLWRRTKLTKSLTSNQRDINGRSVQIFTRQLCFHGSNVAQRGASKNHWELIFVANQAPAIRAEHGNTLGMLAVIDGGEIA